MRKLLFGVVLQLTVVSCGLSRLRTSLIASRSSFFGKLSPRWDWRGFAHAIGKGTATVMERHYLNLTARDELGQRLQDQLRAVTGREKFFTGDTLK